MTEIELALLMISIMPGVDSSGRGELGRRLTGSQPDSTLLGALIEGRPQDEPGFHMSSPGAARLADGSVRTRAETLAGECQRLGISLVFNGSDMFPEFPARMVSAPPVLYVRGNPELLTNPSGRVAMVGTRKASQLGLRFARRSAAELAEAGLIVVSGMALGIDAAVHRGALDSAGLTVAVLASGVDELTPKRNEALGMRILERGAVVSERPPGTRVGPWSFPERNRIIAGLGSTTVILEAGLRSGSQHTAEKASEYGQELYVMPGRPGDPLTAGCLNLLRNKSVQPFVSAADLLQALQISSGAPAVLDPELLKLAHLLRDHLPCRLDELPDRLGLRDRVPILLGGVNLLKLYNVLHEDASGYLNLVATLPAAPQVPVNST